MRRLSFRVAGARNLAAGIEATRREPRERVNVVAVLAVLLCGAVWAGVWHLATRCVG